MKKLIIFLFVSICFCRCIDKKETIDFIPLKDKELSAIPFKLPNNKIIDSLKEAHNLCMGVSFDPNAILFGTKNTFFIGTIINKTSGEVVATTKGLGITIDQAVSQYSMITTPCYKKSNFHLPLKSILGENFSVELLNANEKMNKEINDAIFNSDNSEVETGSWIYLDMKEALKKILDTAKSSKGIKYKNDLLDTTNIVLIAAESIMNVRIIINTEKKVSEPLEALLKTKPSAVIPNSTSLSKTDVKLYYLDSNKFEIYIDGFFPIAGQFVKAELK
ncbi:MAG: hypothetical protein ABJB11_21605 [Ferruginibacter sp.]